MREAFSLRVTCVRSFRAGKKLPGKERLLIVSLENIEIKREILRLAPQLWSIDEYSKHSSILTCHQEKGSRGESYERSLRHVGSRERRTL